MTDETTPAVGTDTDSTDTDANPDIDPERDRMEAADLFVPRDSDGELQGIETTAAGYGDIVVTQLTYGDAEAYFGDAGGAAMVGPGVIADVLSTHVIEPDLNDYVAEMDHVEEDRLTARVVAEEMEPFAPQAILTAILQESGLDNVDVDVGADGSAEVAFEGN